MDATAQLCHPFYALRMYGVKRLCYDANDLYLGSLWPLPPLPDDCSVERVGKSGNLIVITSIKEPLTVSNPAHVAAVRRLSEVLERAGMLAPIPPAHPL
jgi:hypothetical protein